MDVNKSYRKGTDFSAKQPKRRKLLLHHTQTPRRGSVKLNDLILHQC